MNRVEMGVVPILLLPALLLNARQAAISPDETIKRPRWMVRAEGGQITSAYNRYAEPFDSSGTTFSFNDVLGKSRANFVRLTAEYQLTPAGGLRVAYVPLRQTGTGSISQTVNFKGQTFNPGQISGLYQFNGYRFTYFRAFGPKKEGFEQRAGYTINIRDARVRLEQGSTIADRKNIGLVPLGFYSATWSDRSGGTTIEVEGAGFTQGRVIELTLLRKFNLSAQNTLLIGARGFDGEGQRKGDFFNRARFYNLFVGTELRF